MLSFCGLSLSAPPYLQLSTFISLSRTLCLSLSLSHYSTAHIIRAADTKVSCTLRASPYPAASLANCRSFFFSIYSIYTVYICVCAIKLVLQLIIVLIEIYGLYSYAVVLGATLLALPLLASTCLICPVKYATHFFFYMAVEYNLYTLRWAIEGVYLLEN